MAKSVHTVRNSVCHFYEIKVIFCCNNRWRETVIKARGSKKGPKSHDAESVVKRDEDKMTTTTMTLKDPNTRLFGLGEIDQNEKQVKPSSWSSLVVEEDEQLDRPNSQTYIECYQASAASNF